MRSVAAPLFLQFVARVINPTEVEKQLATAVFQVIPSAEFAVGMYSQTDGLEKPKSIVSNAAD